MSAEEPEECPETDGHLRERGDAACDEVDAEEPEERSDQRRGAPQDAGDDPRDEHERGGEHLLDAAETVALDVPRAVGEDREAGRLCCEPGGGAPVRAPAGDVALIVETHGLSLFLGDLWLWCVRTRGRPRR